MKVGELLKSSVIDPKYTVIEIEWRKEPHGPYKRMAEGFAEDDEIKRFQDEEVRQFYWKAYPNVVTIFIAD